MQTYVYLILLGVVVAFFLAFLFYIYRRRRKALKQCRQMRNAKKASVCEERVENSSWWDLMTGNIVVEVLSEMVEVALIGDTLSKD